MNVAKRLECDEDKEVFEAALGKIAKAQPGRRATKVTGKSRKPGR